MSPAVTESTVIPAGTWTVDPVHSSVEFRVTDVQDLMSTIRGRFREFEGALETDENFENARAHGVVKAGSVTTDQEQRDQHLRSPDFLDTDRYPEVTFESKRVERSGDDRLRIAGTLTLKEQPEDIEFEARIVGLGESSQGGERLVINTESEIGFGPMKVGLSIDVTTIREGS